MLITSLTIVLNLSLFPSQAIDLRQSDDFFIVEMEDANTDPHGNVQ